MTTRPLRRHCFYVVPHDDGLHFNVYLRAERYYVDTPDVDAAKLARWKGRERSTSRTGGTATLRACGESVTEAEANDAVLGVWLDIVRPRFTEAPPVAEAQRN